MLTTILTILVVWFLGSIPLGLFLGRLFRKLDDAPVFESPTHSVATPQAAGYSSDVAKLGLTRV